MDNDDKPIGTILSRKDVLKILRLGSAATLMAACAPEVIETLSPTTAPATTSVLPTSTLAATQAASVPVPACVVRPEMTEGPYFVDEMLNRSDIRSDPSDESVSVGVPLELTFNVSQVSANGCVVLPNAQVDIWHCDAFGVYSDVENAQGKKFLRGLEIEQSRAVIGTIELVGDRLIDRHGDGFGRRLARVAAMDGDCLWPQCPGFTHPPHSNRNIRPRPGPGVFQIGAARRRDDVHLGLALRIERLLSNISKRIENGSPYESFSEILTAICVAYNPGWLMLARWHIEQRTAEGYAAAKDELRRFLEEGPKASDAAEAWRLLANACNQTVDSLGDVHACIERAQLANNCAV